MQLVDSLDGLPLTEVGKWALEKHERLRRYVVITSATRRKYSGEMRGTNYAGGSSYIDLFCGPGRACLRETDQIIDGSPLVAFKAAVGTKAPFTEIHVADIEQKFCEATVMRLEAIGGKAKSYVGSVHDTVKEITSNLNRYGLHFAFLDPYNLENLTWGAIEQLATLKRMDLLLHVSVSDLQRNIDRYANQENSPLDVFAPGWREEVDIRRSVTAVRAAYIAYWQSKLLKLGFSYRGVELVTGSKKQRLYWLIFLSRSEFAKDLWDEIRNIARQGNLGF
jgi:three-Cys-motif partner protein